MTHLHDLVLKSDLDLVRERPRDLDLARLAS